MKFSERIGATPEKTLKSINDMDDELRNTIWSLLNFYFEKLTNLSVHDPNWEYNPFLKTFSHRLRLDLWKRLLDERKRSPSSEFAWIRAMFFKLDPLEVYDFLDFSFGEFYRHFKEKSDLEKIEVMCQAFNDYLEREKAPVRFVDSQLVEITSEVEIKDLETAKQDALTDVRVHLQKAINSFSDRENPNYEATITEAVKALEAKLQDIAGSLGTMDKALKKLVNEEKIDPQLKEAMTKLYAFRGAYSHGNSSEIKPKRPVTSAEARLTLITASALINFLTETYPREVAPSEVAK